MRSDQNGTGEEVKIFREKHLWPEGYFEADPMAPVCWTSYTSAGFVSVWHAAYLTGIRPFINNESVVLEIGPGGGAWTKVILERGAKQVFALDVQSEKTNKIRDRVGEHYSKVDYIQVEDFSCSSVDDLSCNFFWSFGCFVHISPDGQAAYIRNIFNKLLPGSHGFVQIADIEVWNHIVGSDHYRIDLLLEAVAKRDDPDASIGGIPNLSSIKTRESVDPAYINDVSLHPGRYFYTGLQWFCEKLEEAGFQIIDRNAVPSLRDPLIHFYKPMPAAKSGKVQGSKTPLKRFFGFFSSPTD